MGCIVLRRQDTEGRKQMVVNANFFLLLAALVCFLLGTFNAPVRINIVALGLAFFILSLLIK
jgi:hypothetical protein